MHFAFLDVFLVRKKSKNNLTLMMFNNLMPFGFQDLLGSFQIAQYR